MVKMVNNMLKIGKLIYFSNENRITYSYIERVVRIMDNFASKIESFVKHVINALKNKRNNFYINY